MLTVPGRFEPVDGEAAVLSLLAVRRDGAWTLVTGSLVTVPLEVAEGSWQQWRDAHPSTGRPADVLPKFDLGPEFDEEPFDDVRVIRQVVSKEDWLSKTIELAQGHLDIGETPVSVAPSDSSPVVRVPTSGAGDATSVLAGVMRPVSAIVATLPETPMPKTDGTWVRDTGGGSHEMLTGWSQALLGIGWPPGSELAPPNCLVIGRMESDAWIADVRPGEDGELNVFLGWNENALDPLGCALLPTAAHAGLPILRRQIRLADLPAPDAPTAQQLATYKQSWRDHLVVVNLPRGPRGSEWGVALIAADGRVLDEWPVAPRVESIHLEIGIMGGAGPPTTVTVGDKGPAPTAVEQTDAAQAAVVLEAQARKAAAERRVSTLGELELYLRWRFSCRAGELLLLDPYLFSSDVPEVIDFLKALDRPIRAMTPGIPKAAVEALKAIPAIDARKLPGGQKELHDRVWIVGETGLLVGTSIGSFLPKPGGKEGRATTASELPHADAEVWRGRFEAWWAKTSP